MKTLQERAEKVRIKYPVAIPTVDGEGIAHTVEVEVEALKDPVDDEIYLDGDARELIEKTKARHMGLLLPEEIKELREQLGVTQKRMAELLQIGEKSYCRWETGRERPSRSMNLLLSSLSDGRIDVAYLDSRLKPNFDWRRQVERTVPLKERVIYFDFRATNTRAVEEPYETVAS